MSDPVSDNGTPWNQLPGATGGIRRKLTPRPTGATSGNFFLDMIGGIIKAIMGIFIPGDDSPIPGLGSGNALAFLSDLLTLRWDQVDSIEDGQLALNDRVDLISPLEDFGSCYSLGDGGLLVNGTGVKKFDRQIGPMTGCHLDGSGRIVLDDYGLWRIDARMSFSWTAIPGGSELRWFVRVLRPDGSVFSEIMDRVFDANYTTRNISGSVVVPAVNYRVEVYVSTIVGGREIFGGPSQNLLQVHHINRSTDFQI